MKYYVDRANDLAVKNNPPYFRYLNGASTFVLLPLGIVAVYGLIKRKEWYKYDLIYHNIPYIIDSKILYPSQAHSWHSFCGASFGSRQFVFIRRVQPNQQADRSQADYRSTYITIILLL
jgi:hypothetical protein